MDRSLSKAITVNGRISALHLSNVLKEEKDLNKKDELIAEAVILMQENIKTNKTEVALSSNVIVKKIEELIAEIKMETKKGRNEIIKEIKEIRILIHNENSNQTKLFIGVITAYVAFLIISIKLLMVM